MAETMDILGDIKLNTQSIPQSAKDIGKAADALESIWVTAEEANEGIKNLIDSLSKLKTSTKNIGTQNISRTLNQIYADKGMSTYMGAGGSAVQLDPSNKQNQQYMIEIQNQILRQEIEYEEHLKKLNQQTAEKIAKLQQENANYDKILENQTKYANAALLKQQNDAQLLNSKNALNNARADYYSGKGKGTDWYDAQLALMRSRNKVNELKAENPEYFQHGGRKRSVKYQIGMGFIDSGAYLGKHISKPLGNAISTITQIIGTSLSNPAMGAAVGINQLTKAITELMTASIKSYSEIEAIKTQLGVVYGNDTQAGDAFTGLAGYAIKSPFGVQQIAELAILLKQSGVEATNLMGTMKMLGDTAGGNMEKMKRIANNYAQIVSIGKASMLDMRQFAYAGIPIFEKVAEELNVSQTALRKMISEGKVTSEVITKVFKDMTSEGGLFFEATAKGADTLKARLTNLGDIKSLAAASFGEKVLRSGEKTGNDSLYYKGLEFSENFYTKLNNLNVLKNLEKSVRTIANNNSEVDKLKNAVEYYINVNGLDKKAAEKDPVVIELRNKIKELSSIFDPDKTRSIRSTLYDVYNGYLSQMSEAQARKIINSNVDTMNDFKGRRLNIENTYQKKYDIVMNTPGYTQDQKNKVIAKYDEEKNAQLSVIDAEQAVYEELLKNAKKALDYYKKNKLTEEIEDAHQEKEIIVGQQGIYDLAHESRGKSTSIDNVLSEMMTAKQQSPEYKEEQERLQKERWQKVINLVSSVSKAIGESGIINMSKTNSTKLLELLNAGGLYTRRLAVTYEDNPKQAEADKSTLNSQYKQMTSEIIGDFEKNKLGTDILQKLKTAAGSIDSTSTMMFYSTFRESYDTFRDTLEKEIERNENSPEVKAFLESQLKKLELSTVEASLVGEIPENAMKLLEDAKKREFIPLWKRLIATVTGLSANVIEDETEALNAYRDDLAVRSATKDIVGNWLSAGGDFNSVNKLFSADGTRKRLRESGRDTYQIDWKQVRENIEKFSLSLRSSTVVVDSYKKSLNSQLDAYIKLAQAAAEGETQDIKKQKFVSTKHLAEIMQDQGEQLVNAFGDGLQTKSGATVKIKTNSDGSVSFEDEKGEAVAEDQLVITNKLFDFLMKEIPEIRKKINKAERTSLENSILEKMQKEGFESVLSNKAAVGKDFKTLSFLSDYSDEFAQMFSINLRDRLKEGQLESDVIGAYLSGDKEAIKTVTEVLEQTNAQAQKFMNSDFFLNLTKTLQKKEERDKKTSAYHTFMGFAAGPNTASFLKPGETLTSKFVDDMYRSGVMSRVGLEGMTIADLAEMLGEEGFKNIPMSSYRNRKITRAQNRLNNITRDSNELFMAQQETASYSLQNDKDYNYRAILHSNKLNDMLNQQSRLEDLIKLLEQGEAYTGMPAPAKQNYIEELASVKNAIEKENTDYAKEQEQYEENKATYAKYDLDYEKQLSEQNELRIAQQEKLAELKSVTAEQAIKEAIAEQEIVQALKDANDNMTLLVKDSLKLAYLSPFETLGKDLVSLADNTKDLKGLLSDIGTSLKSIAGQLISNMGSEMATAGFRIASAAALESNWAMVAAGLGLAAAGGVASGFGSYIQNADKDKDKTKEELDRLNSLKDQLLKIIDQAKTDANYYENNMRHKEALSYAQSVNDAIITPNGNVITTHPDDYLIATKTPGSLGGSSPNISFNVVNMNGQAMNIDKVEKKQSGNDIEITAYLTAAIGNEIANGNMDQFFDARTMRLQGRNYMG